MDSTLITGIVVGVVFALVVLLVVLLVYYVRKFKATHQQLLNATSTLEEVINTKNAMSQQLTDLQVNFKENILVDPVTNLPSFKVFEDRLMQILHQSQRHGLVFAVVFLDIDDFKVISNVLGFDAGNILLKELVARLHSCIRKVDTICHLGGESFAFILPHLHKAETAAYVARRILDAVTQPCRVVNRELFVTASVGITVYPTDALEANQLLKYADIALQQAKSRGRNIYQFYHEELYALSHRELILNSCLRSDAVYQEFTLYYQPILNIVTKEIVGMEALLRWQHPDLGMVPPQDFLRLAENNGRIGAIGEWVLRAACTQYVAWRAQGLHLRNVAVNVSLRHLEQPSFTYKVSQMMQEVGMDPQGLMLEVSESVLLPKLTMVEKTLNMLKHLGVQVAIDDFGTGYLSLQHLRRFPANCLKIDGTLVQQMLLENESEAIIKTIITLAKSLQLEIIAEGVESERQKKLLKDLGCTMMQGYIFCRPLLAEEFTRALLMTIKGHL